MSLGTKRNPSSTPLLVSAAAALLVALLLLFTSAAGAIKAVVWIAAGVVVGAAIASFRAGR